MIIYESGIVLYCDKIVLFAFVPYTILIFSR